MCSIGPVVPTQLTRSVNVGVVNIPGGTATLVVSGNTSREKLLLTYPYGDPGIYIAPNSGVSNTNGYLLPYSLLSQYSTGTLVQSSPPGGITIDWPTDVWAWSANPGATLTYAEEILS